MIRKQLASPRVEIKDDARGEIVAVFSTFDVVDADGDVTRRGAFTDNGPVVMSAYGHTSWDGALPVGKGTIRELKTEAVADLRVFVDTQAGADTFTTIKELGDLQEWSYGYEPVEYSFGEHDGQQVRFLDRLKVFEVSPVLRGAGVGTRTVSAKSKFSEHAASVLADVEQLVSRASEVVALRAEKGKSLGEESALLLRRLDGELVRLRALVDGPATTSDVDVDDLARLKARFVASLARAGGVT